MSIQMCKLCVKGESAVDLEIVGDVECCEKILGMKNVTIFGNLSICNTDRIFALRNVKARNITIAHCSRLCTLHSVSASSIYLHNLDVIDELEKFNSENIVIINCPSLYFLNEFKTESVYISDCKSLIKNASLVINKDSINTDNVFAAGSKINGAHF